jgi:hypothetical protein
VVHQHGVVVVLVAPGQVEAIKLYGGLPLLQAHLDLMAAQVGTGCHQERGKVAGPALAYLERREVNGGLVLVLELVVGHRRLLAQDDLGNGAGHGRAATAPGVDLDDRGRAARAGQHHRARARKGRPGAATETKKSTIGASTVRPGGREMNTPSVARASLSARKAWRHPVAGGDHSGRSSPGSEERAEARLATRAPSGKPPVLDSELAR